MSEVCGIKITVTPESVPVTMDIHYGFVYGDDVIWFDWFTDEHIKKKK